MHNVRVSRTKRGVVFEVSAGVLLCLFLCFLLVAAIVAAYIGAVHILPAVADFQKNSIPGAPDIASIEQTVSETVSRELERSERRQDEKVIVEMQEELRAMREVLDYLFKPASPEPGSGMITPTMDLRIPSGLTIWQLDTLLHDTPIEGEGINVFRAERLEGVNGLLLVSLSAHESGWWTSKIFRDKNNGFGMGAYDHAPYASAFAYETFRDGLMATARHLRLHYLNPGGDYFHGPNLQGVNIAYASDDGWADGVVQRSRQLQSML